MINKAEILARLANGEDAQAIADEIANVLNEAISDHIDAQEQARKNQSKANDVAAIMDAMLDFLEKYYPDIYDVDLRDYDANEILEAVEASAEEARKITKAMGTLDELVAAIAKLEDSECKCKDKRTDPIEEFLNKYVN